MTASASTASAAASAEPPPGSSHTAARTFVKLFVDEAWKPFDEVWKPFDERWPEIIVAIKQLRPLAVKALNATFRLVLSAEVEKAFGEVLEQRRKS